MHSELIARLEAATGPDRELDGLIAQAVGAKHGPDGGWSNIDNGDYWTVGECAKPYTASIDAALTLAENKDETLRDALRWLNKKFHLHINPWPEGENYVQWLALAIVIAAIRAKGVLNE